MLDFFNIEKYKENNRLEAKAAAVGLPKSLWATYSAFANTNGGIILLGVTEDAQHQLHVEGVNDADALVIDFWNIINNQSKISINVLNDKDVIVREFDGKKIIIISVPRAQRYDKPIYLDGNLFSSYKRNGEGDYRCTKEVIQAMLRDASPKTQDMLVLGNMNLDVFDKDTIKRYRIRMQGIRPGHVWEALEDVDFLYLNSGKFLYLIFYIADQIVRYRKNAHPVCHDNVEVQCQFIIIQCNCNALGNAVALQQLDKTALHCSAHANDAETLHRHCSRILTNHFIINRNIAHMGRHRRTLHVITSFFHENLRLL